MKYPAYSYRDWKFGKPLPDAFKAHQATSKYGWSQTEIDKLVLSLLPGKAQTNGQAQWVDEDMRSGGWRVLPYGISFGKHGATVFDREYLPICSVNGAGVRLLDVHSQDWRHGEVLYLYHDEATPRRNAETRRLCGLIVNRLGLASELKRRAVLERAGFLPRPLCILTNRPPFYQMPWAKALGDAITRGKIFVYDMATGAAIRTRRPLATVGAWKHRPVTDGDLVGAGLWLKSQGLPASKKNIAAVIEVTAALRPVLYLPD